MPKTEKEAMTHDPVLHALIDLCQEISKRGSTVMWEDAKAAYARAMDVIRDHTAPGGDPSPRYVQPRHPDEIIAFIIGDIKGRAGIGDAWNDIDVDIRNEIAHDWRKFISLGEGSKA